MNKKTQCTSNEWTELDETRFNQLVVFVPSHLKAIVECSFKCKKSLKEVVSLKHKDIINECPSLVANIKSNQYYFFPLLPRAVVFNNANSLFSRSIKMEKQRQELQELQLTNVNKPSFFVVGVPRSATTWIYKQLKEHQDVFLPSEKEIEFFGTCLKNLGINYYHQKFIGDKINAKVTGEVSVSYFSNPAAIDEIYDYSKGKAKIIVCIRNPIERALSHYYFMSKKTIVPKDFFGVYKNEFFRERIIDEGYYFEQLKKIEKKFGKKNLHIASYDGIKDSPQKEFDKLCGFLDVGSYKIDSKKVNKSSYLIYLGFYQKLLWLKMFFAAQKNIIRYFAPILNAILKRYPSISFSDSLSRLSENEVIFLESLYKNELTWINKE